MAMLSGVLLLLCLTTPAHMSPVQEMTTDLPHLLTTLRYDDVISVPSKNLEREAQAKHEAPILDKPQENGTFHSDMAQGGQDNGKTRSGQWIHRLVTSRDKFRTPIRRKGEGTGKSRGNPLLQRNGKGQQSDKETSEGNDQTSDSDYDNDYTDYYNDYDYSSDTYSLAHFRDEIYQYVDNKTAKVNQSTLSELQAMKSKIAELEKQITEQSAHTQRLESMIQANGDISSVTHSPAEGDLRLVNGNGEIETETPLGYLQVYTGSVWGFVCDDFFFYLARRIACKQLGFPDLVTRDTSGIPWLNGAVTNDGWKDKYEIVLDDVMCTTNDTTLLSCRHSQWGEHDCFKGEIVFLIC